MKKRICALLAVIAVVVSLLPAAVAAQPTTYEGQRRVSRYYLVTSEGVMWQWKDKDGILEEPIWVREGVVAVSDAIKTTIWIDQNGTLWGQGTNEYNQLGATHNIAQGVGQVWETALKEPVRLMEGVKDAYANEEFVLALDRNGILWGWGKQDAGQLGLNGSWMPRGNSTPVKVLENVAQFDCTGLTGIALKKDGTVWTWGSNDRGILGRGSLSAGPQYDKNAAQVLDGAIWVSIIQGTGAAVKADGTLWIWGAGGSHVYALPETEAGWTWGPFQSWEGVSCAATSVAYAAALKADGSLWKVGCPLEYNMGEGNNGAISKPNREILLIEEQVARTWANLYVTLEGDLYQWTSKNGEIEKTLIMAGFGATDPTQAAEIPSDWAKGDVERAKNLGLLTTSTSGGYRSNISRMNFTGLMVNMVEKALGHELPQITATNRFSDVADVSIIKALDAGIVNGAGDGTFGANDPITREQAASVLRRAMDYIGKETGKSYLTASTDLSAYTDGAQVAVWHTQDVATMAASGIMQGAQGRLSPQNSITVEESILLVLRLYETVK